MSLRKDKLPSLTRGPERLSCGYQCFLSLGQSDVLTGRRPVSQPSLSDPQRVRLTSPGSEPIPDLSLTVCDGLPYCVFCVSMDTAIPPDIKHS